MDEDFNHPLFGGNGKADDKDDDSSKKETETKSTTSYHNEPYAVRKAKSHQTIDAHDILKDKSAPYSTRKANSHKHMKGVFGDDDEKSMFGGDDDGFGDLERELGGMMSGKKRSAS